MLPTGAPWMATKLTIPGGSSKTPLTLYYRDAAEVFKSLFGNPAFADGMDFAPQKIWTNGQKLHRVYKELMSGNWAWEMQVSGEFNNYFKTNADQGLSTCWRNSGPCDIGL